MQVLRGLHGIEFEPRAAAVSIGNFDGVHRGHQAVIGNAVRAAAEREVAAVVCTFDPHTRILLDPEAPPRLLETLDQRLEVIEGLGVDVAVVIPFTQEVARVTHEEFVASFLVGTLGAVSVHVSDGFRFGTHGRGSIDFLRITGRTEGFAVDVVPAVMANGRPVSSTRIRDALVEGRLAEANELLGRPFALVGRVVHGAGRGRDLDAPTANLDFENGCVPAAGVYVTEARIAESAHPAVANVGVRPTFGAGGDLTVEAHLLDHHGELYGERMELAFLERLRGERQFESAEALAAQIQQDVQQALARFAS